MASARFFCAKEGKRGRGLAEVGGKQTHARSWENKRTAVVVRSYLSGTFRR